MATSLQFPIRALLWLVVVASLASSLYRFGNHIRGEIGSYSYIHVVGPMGPPETRLQKELAHLIIRIVGVPGFNSSGRPGDDPYWDLENYPPIALSCIVVGSIVAIIGTVVGVRTLKGRARGTVTLTSNPD